MWYWSQSIGRKHCRSSCESIWALHSDTSQRRRSARWSKGIIYFARSHTHADIDTTQIFGFSSCRLSERQKCHSDRQNIGRLLKQVTSWTNTSNSITRRGFTSHWIIGLPLKSISKNQPQWGKILELTGSNAMSSHWHWRSYPQPSPPPPCSERVEVRWLWITPGRWQEQNDKSRRAKFTL